MNDADEKIVAEESNLCKESAGHPVYAMDYHPDDARMLVMSLIRCRRSSRSFYKVQRLDRTVDSCSRSLMKCATSYFHIASRTKLVCQLFINKLWKNTPFVFCIYSYIATQPSPHCAKSEREISLQSDYTARSTKELRRGKGFRAQNLLRSKIVQSR